MQLTGKTILITGATSGIGVACARLFASQGAHLVLIGRRKNRLEELARELSGTTSGQVYIHPLDVRHREAVQKVIEGLKEPFSDIDVLINNAGLARGLDPLHEGRWEDWEEMIDTNLKGLLYVTRAVLPIMIRRNKGHIVNIGSIAGRQVYPKGNVYCATKFAVRALSYGLLMELVDKPIRITTVDPGMVKTEFSLVRFRGNKDRAEQTYKGITPLSPEDVAEAILFVITRPPHVNISEIVLLPTNQASVYHIHKEL